MSDLDLDKIRDEYLKQCGPHDFGLVEYGCNCPSGEPRWAIRRLADEVERLRQELDEARAERERLEADNDDLQTRLNILADAVHEATTQRLDVVAERDRLRPVVEAAEAWAGAPFASNDMPALTRDLVKAVETYRSATPDAEPAPGVPVDTEATP